MRKPTLARPVVNFDTSQTTAGQSFCLIVTSEKFHFTVSEALNEMS